MKPANGVLILVLGILSFVGMGCLTGIPAWIMGNNSMRDINAGVADPSERSMVEAGRVLGMINTILVIVAVGIWFLFFGGIVLLGLAGAAANGPGPR